MGTTTEDDEWMERLTASRAHLRRSSTAERVAELLREQIIEGKVLPGTRLSDTSLAETLDVSRNTMREAFRLLTHEGLLEYRFNQGVSVRVLTVDDVVDLYRVRRILECAAVRQAAKPFPEALAAVWEAVREGEHAAEKDRWWDVGAANMHFHRALCRFARSARVNELMGQLSAELGLVFHVMAERREFHERYLERHRPIARMLERGEAEAAERMLSEYLDTAEAQLVEAYTAVTEHGTTGRGPRESRLA